MEIQSNTVVNQSLAPGVRVKHIYNVRWEGRVVDLPDVGNFKGQARVAWNHGEQLFHPVKFLAAEGQAFVAPLATADVVAIEDTEDAAGVLELGQEAVEEEEVESAIEDE